MIIEFPRDRRRIETSDACHAPARMTDDEYAAQADRVKSLVTSLIPTMGLSSYDARLELVPGPIDSDGTVMMIRSDWRYKWLTLTASIEQCARESDEELTYDVLHEGAHVYLARLRPSELTDAQCDQEELTATEIGQMGMRCLRQGYDQGYAEGAADLAEKQATIVSLQQQVKKLEKQVAKGLAA